MAHEFAYPIVLTEEPSGGFVVSCPDLPELLTQGDDRADAVEQAIDALEEAIAGRIRRGDDIPEASVPGEGEDVEVIRLPPIMAAKAALALALTKSGVSQSAFARSLGINEKEVRRLLDPRHPSKLPRLQKALMAVNREVEIRVVEVATPEIRETEARSYRDVSSAAEELVCGLFPDAIERGEPIPVNDLLSTDRLTEITGTQVRFVTDDALVEDGASEFCEGELVLRLRSEIQERADNGDGRCRFTIAHEIGHLALHRSDLVNHQGRAFRDIVTPTDKLSPGVPIFRSPEWQANAWAAAFLMPLPAVRNYLERLSETNEEFTMEEFACHFQVSRQAAAIRLERLLPDLVKPVPGL
jgi:antitoxin HicB